jgi:5-methylcytosine-specific restriction endonuclease McrA
MPFKDLGKRREYARAYHQARKLNDSDYLRRKRERESKRQRRRLQEDPIYAERRRQESRAYREKRSIDNPHFWRENGLLIRYGLTLAEKRALYEAQNGCCAICHTPFETLTAAFVDHKHEEFEVRNKRGKRQVRGLLCSRCNLALGQFNESISLLTNAIDYLRQFTDLEGA